MVIIFSLVESQNEEKDELNDYKYCNRANLDSHFTAMPQNVKNVKST